MTVTADADLDEDETRELSENFVILGRSNELNEASAIGGGIGTEEPRHPGLSSTAMVVTFRSGDITVDNAVTNLTVGLGRKFVLRLKDVRPGARLRWTTENDPVLDLRESEDKMMARVKATELGVSTVFISGGVLDTARVVVTVVPMNDGTNEAVRLNGRIGEQSPDA